MKQNVVKTKIVEECVSGKDLTTPTEKSCEKIDGEFCSVYPFPALMWRHKLYCPMATHSKLLAENRIVEKVRVGQQKQKKK